MTVQFRLFDITKAYGDRQVVNIDHLEIESEQIYAVLGPNGAGKTTLLRILSLLTKASSGTLEVFGENIDYNQAQMVRLKRQMAMVTQSSFMFEGSVYYNVAYGLKARKLPAKEREARVKESLELLGMQDFIDYPARKLSGGERQKVAIARTLAVQPKVLFLDEPTSNIDPSSAMEIEKHIRHINAERKTTIILITHNLFQARRLADHTSVIWEGKIIERGKTEALFQVPADIRTRAFLQGEY